MRLKWLITKPFDSDRAVHLQVGGRFEIPAATQGGDDPALIDVLALYPQWIVSAGLAADSKIDLIQIFDYFKLNVEGIGINDMNCTGLELSADIDDQLFDFMVEITGDWSINAFQTDFKFTRLSFGITNDPKLVGTIGGTVEIGNNVSIKADYDTSKGLVLEADVGTLNLKDLLSELSQTDLFDGLPISFDFLDFDINNINVLIDISSKKFSVSGQTEHLGKAELIIRKEDKWGFEVSFEADNFKLSDITSALEFMDALTFEKTQLYFSSFDFEK